MTKKVYKINIAKFLFATLLIFINPSLKAQILQEPIAKALMIVNLADAITWPNEDSLKSFKIVIIGNDPELYQELVNTAQHRLFKGTKPFEIYSVTKADEAARLNPQIVFIVPELNYKVRDISYVFRNKPVLIVTQDIKTYVYTMINIYFTEENGLLRIHFKYNSENLKAAGFTYDQDLVYYGGSSVDFQQLFKQKEQELSRMRTLVKEQNKKLDSTKLVVDSQLVIIERQKQSIEQRKRQIEIMKQELEAKKQELDKAGVKYVGLMDEIKQKEATLNRKIHKIEELEFKLDSQKNAINAKSQYLNALKADIEKNKEIIERQRRELKSMQNKFSTQSKSLVYLMLILFFFVIFVLILVRNYRMLKKYSKDLQEKNFEVEAQKKQLLAINKELEKLSIVASRTDNVIILVRPDGIVEWCNTALERHYGYTKDEIIGKYFGEVAASVEARKHLNLCVEKKEPVIYENLYSTKDGNLLYIQTTLTPILDENEQIRWIVVIDTDITELKKAQAQIEKRNRLLMLQRDELIKQKQKIEQQSLIIRSSVEYAQRILQSILPLKEQIPSFIKEYFILFLPKDIVSGDFYWAGKSRKHPQYDFVAVVDCTGHGVPGAFMALISNRLLVEVIEQQGIVEPAEILERLDKEVHAILRHNSSAEGTPDGFDIALFRFEQLADRKYTLVFAGAKRPLVYFEPYSNELTFIKGSRRSIGGIWSELTTAKFEQIEMVVESGTLFYAYTDGFIDQGNDLKKRYGTPRFLEFLKLMRNEPLERQRDMLYNEFIRWKKNFEQRDDITVWGFKIS